MQAFSRRSILPPQLYPCSSSPPHKRLRLLTALSFRAHGQEIHGRKKMSSGKNNMKSDMQKTMGSATKKSCQKPKERRRLPTAATMMESRCA